MAEPRNEVSDRKDETKDCTSCLGAMAEYAHTCGKFPEATELDGHLYIETCQCRVCLKCRRPMCFAKKVCPGWGRA